MENIHFDFFEVPDFFEEKQGEKLASWLCEVAKNEKVTILDLSYVFVSDDFLLQMNINHLNHDTYTDIITFDLSDDPDADIEGEIFISVDRVRENAGKYEVAFNEELHRVIVHGLLHLIGYDDHSDEDRAIMREKEDEYTALQN